MNARDIGQTISRMGTALAPPAARIVEVRASIERARALRANEPSR